jgi:hypothetical protein
MKMPALSNPRFPRHASREGGSAVIVVIALLSIILIYLAGNVRCLNLLKRDLALIDRQQTRRLETAGRTNAVPGKLSPSGANQADAKSAPAGVPAVAGH